MKNGGWGGQNFGVEKKEKAEEQGLKHKSHGLKKKGGVKSRRKKPKGSCQGGCGGLKRHLPNFYKQGGEKRGGTENDTQ